MFNFYLGKAAYYTPYRRYHTKEIIIFIKVMGIEVRLDNRNGDMIQKSKFENANLKSTRYCQEACKSILPRRVDVTFWC